MKFKIDTKIVCLIVGLTLGISFSANMTSSYYSEPGSTSDPVVTLSYVEMKINELKEELRKEFSSSQGVTTTTTATVTEANANSSTSDESSSTVFKVIELKTGDRVFLGESSEFILRSGEAQVIEGPGGGLADLTTGVDLKDKEIVPLNHLNLAARGDGRGVDAITDGWILIKGKYSLINQ